MFGEILAPIVSAHVADDMGSDRLKHSRCVQQVTPIWNTRKEAAIAILGANV